LSEIRKKIMAEKPEDAQHKSLKQWGLRTSDQAVELAKITLGFLSGQADVLEKLLKDGFQTNSTDGGRIIDLPPSSCNARGVVEGSEELKEAEWKCDREKALVSAGALLSYKAGILKVASVRAGIYHGKETAAAQSLLEKVGLMRFVLYKPLV
jgi:hypothetical protein